VIVVASSVDVLDVLVVVGVVVHSEEKSSSMMLA
jgi:hypothetical protein